MPSKDMQDVQRDSHEGRSQEQGVIRENHLLNILCCTIVGRERWVAKLKEHFAPQLTDEVNLVFDCDEGEVSIGVKRNRMLQASAAKYVVFFDDDDTPHPEYITLVLDALRQDPDCVGYKMVHYMDGYRACGFVMSNERGRVVKEPDQFFTRHITNHINPHRRELAIQVPFPDENMGEDTVWALDFHKKFRELKEVFIDEVMYEYWFRRRRDGELTNKIRQRKEALCSTS